MKSWLGAFIAGSITALGVWAFYENKQLITKYVKDISTKTEQMLQKFKGPMMNENSCCCGGQTNSSSQSSTSSN